MFEGGVSKSFSIFPIRVVYMPVEQGEAPYGCRWCRDYPNSAHNPRDSGNQVCRFRVHQWEFPSLTALP